MVCLCSNVFQSNANDMCRVQARGLEVVLKQVESEQ